MAGPRRQDDVVIRERQAADDDAIRQLNDAAFGGLDESRLVEGLRAVHLAAVELVAVEGTAVTGHILFSPLAVTCGKKAIRALSLAPMSVQPGQQRSGIGSALVRAGLKAAKARDWQAVFVLGHPDFYPRFGFSTALARPFKAPFSGEAFMALELEPGALDGGDGHVVYPPPFGIAAD